MRIRIVVMGVFLAALASTRMVAQNGSDLFQQGLARQMANGDIQGAIQLYERIVRDFPSDRPLIARALVQLGRCYETLGQAKSREYFEQVVSKYADQADMAAEARTRLAANASGPLQTSTQPTDDPFSFALSPDGRSVVFAVATAGAGQLWLHDLGSGKAAPIAGANLVRSSTSPSGGAAPFWSPDSKSIGFFSDQKLKRIAAAGGIAQTLADAPAPAGGTWNRDGVILFTPAAFGVYRVSADGSGPAVALGTGRNSHPQFLPDGRHFLYYSLTASAAAGEPAPVLRIGSLDNPEIKTLSVQALSGIFAAPDQLLYATRSGLFAQRLNLQTLELSGTSNRVLDRVAVVPASGAIAVSASDSGELVYRRNIPAMERQFVWLDRQGQPTGITFSPDPAEPHNARISPDGRTVVFGRNAGGGSPFGTVWTIADAAGAQAQTGFQWVGAQVSVWAPAGKGLIVGFWREEKPVPNLALGRGAILRESDDGEQPDDWSRDGHFLLYEKVVGGDLMAVQLQTGASPFPPLQAGAPIPVAQTSAAERNGRFSPNGKWVVYQSNAMGGRNEIFIQPFPGSPDDRRRVSLNGGTNPAWRGDGRELYFLSPDFHVMVVPVTFPEGGGVAFGTPAPLFPAAVPIGSEYDVSNDGQRFLINRPNPTNIAPIMVLSNWNQGK